VLPELEYLSWIAGRPEAATHDLASSDLRPGGPDDAVVPDPLADLPAADDQSVETRLADRYDVSPEAVLVMAGATGAVFVAVATALADGERVLVESPGYEPHHATPAGLGATVNRFDRPRSDGYALDPDRVESALRPETALVAVTNRHNPSGARTDRETLAAVADCATDHGARLLVDEVYGPYAGDGGRGFGGVTAAGLDGAVTVGSLTKFHGLGELRVGWLVADESFVERARRVQQHLGSVARPSRALASRALANADALAEQSRTLAARNGDLLAAFLDERPSLSGHVPAGCPYGLVRHARFDGDDLAAVADREGVLVVPGRFFGVSDAVRVSLGRSPAEMEAALAAFGRALDGADG